MATKLTTQTAEAVFDAGVLVEGFDDNFYSVTLLKDDGLAHQDTPFIVMEFRPGGEEHCFEDLQEAVDCFNGLCQTDADFEKSEAEVKHGR
jgi:hypothetical protein